jgi:RNA polymerase sigma-70 factor (ECF subfamily)
VPPVCLFLAEIVPYALTMKIELDSVTADSLVNVRQPISEPTLAHLLHRTAQKDKAAFAALYDMLEGPLYRFLRSRLNDPFEAADVSHEVFLELWNNASRFEGRSSVKTWVFGIAYRKAMDVHRRAARLDYSDTLPDTEEDSADSEACMIAVEQGAHVRACLEALKPDHRTAIELAFFDDLSYREISEITDAPEGTVKTRVFHAKKLLMHCLAGRVGKGAL